MPRGLDHYGRDARAVAGKGTGAGRDDMGQRGQNLAGWADTVRDLCWQWLIRKGTPGMGAGSRRRGSTGRSSSAVPGAEPCGPGDVMMPVTAGPSAARVLWAKGTWRRD
jgi:hypothetical protein